MDEPTDPLPPPPSPVASAAKPVGRWMLPRWPVLIGVIGLGAVVTTGVAVKRGADARQYAELQAIRTEMSGLRAGLSQYQERMGSLRWNAHKFRAGADATVAEPAKSWARERARHFDALVARIDRTAEEAAFAKLSSELEAACARGDVATARERLLQLPEVRFPSVAKFRELQAELYLKPLAATSRQNPSYYRAFQQQEPEAAKEDIAALRQEIAAADLGAVTPQSMLKLELLSEVASPGDPLLDDFAALTSAADFFDNPDAATLAGWRRARRAIRAQDWQTATAEMQSILRSTVRTRQPFRAAYGHALIKNRPDEAGTAYPFMEEAATAGDAAARKWLVEEDLAKGRSAQALRRLEAAVMAGDAADISKLLELYAKRREEVPRDLARQAGVLQRITVAPDAPPLASMLLARLYEEGGGVAASPENAFVCYQRAAEQRHVPAWPEMARRYLRGEGVPQDLDQARDWACRAFSAGEQAQALPILIELMQTAPERAASAVQLLFDNEQVAAPAGFEDTRLTGASMAELQTQLARYLDQKGRYGQAARFYERSGSRDPGVVKRRAELTTVRPCETCSGAGKVKTTAPCPTCGGKGTVQCPVCDGRGFSYMPGSPPCSTCAGSGQIQQEGRQFVCSACGGTGKGKSSVVKQPCPSCTQGRTACRECTGGRIVSLKECPDCHGHGSRALAED